jgi:hypothetical protein
MNTPMICKRAQSLGMSPATIAARFGYGTEDDVNMLLAAADVMLTQIADDYAFIAGEKIRVELIDGTLWAFGSELATLRILKHHLNGIQGYRNGEFYFTWRI